MRLLDNVFSVWTDEFDHPQNFEKQNWDFDSAIELFYILLTFLNFKKKSKVTFFKSAEMFRILLYEDLESR